MFEEAPDAAGHVVGQIDVIHRIAPQRAHALGAGRGDGGDDPADIRPLRTQGVHQWRRRIDLADRHRVHPHARAPAGMRVGGVALVPSVEIFAHAEAAPHQVVHRHRQQQVEQRRVQPAQQPFDRVFPHACRIREALRARMCGRPACLVIGLACLARPGRRHWCGRSQCSPQVRLCARSPCYPASRPVVHPPQTHRGCPVVRRHVGHKGPVLPA